MKSVYTHRYTYNMSSYLYDGITHWKFFRNKLEFRDTIIRQSKDDDASTKQTDLASHLTKQRVLSENENSVEQLVL